MSLKVHEFQSQPRVSGLSLGRGLSSLITVLEDKQYMVTVREKMNNIKQESCEVLQL